MTLAHIAGAPLPGAFVSLRGRRWLVEGAPANAAPLSSIRLACIDDDAQGEPVEVLWGAEIAPEVEDATAWQAFGKSGADDASTFAAYLQTVRWSSATAADRRLFQAPFRAGIRLSAYQLAPLEQALRLPRVNLLIADDVGLGKTIEAGLIVRELLLRRRLDFFVVAAPPSMTIQWREELAAKFGIAATIVDRDFVGEVRRRRGFSANPWGSGSAFILSHRLLAEESYTAGLRDTLGNLTAKTLFILDEAHHAAPSAGSRYAIDSQFTRAVRDLAPRFEHRLFLTATPHNGHSNAFTALLEMLDPQRFTRGLPFDKRQLDAVMTRRLKADLRELGEPFPERIVEEVAIADLPEDEPELVLARELQAYSVLRDRRLSRLTPKQAASARLVYSGLQQRLLSSIAAFAKTLKVHRDTLAREAARQERELLEVARTYALGDVAIDDLLEGDDEAALAERIDLEDDAAARAASELGAHGATAADLKAERTVVGEMLAFAERHARAPDARVRWLGEWIRDTMKPGGVWNDRRLIVFTEYEDTRRWLVVKLAEALREDLGDGRIRAFTGATPSDERETLKYAFNASPDEDPLRILVCTDAAREGINLQRRCHDLVHFDLPWNPSRIEQRNGRIDRKLQPSPIVTCRYFFYPQREIDVIARALVRKTEAIRNEMGAIGKVIEDRLVERLAEGVGTGRAKAIAEELDREDGGDAVARARRDMDDDHDVRLKRLRERTDRLRTLIEQSRQRVGVDPAALEAVTFAALDRTGVHIDPASEIEIGNAATFGLDPDAPAFAHDSGWVDVLDQLRERPRRSGERIAEWRRDTPLRRIAFEAPILPDGRDPENVVQLHLEHRLVRRLLSRFLAHGFQAGLERTCVLLSDDARPRVILIGRVCLFGPGAARLHEEIIPVAALWHERDRSERPLTPLVERGEAASVSVEGLLRALADAREAPAGIVARCAAFATGDAEALRPAFEERATARMERARADLAKLGEQEASALADLLERQRMRIADGLAEHDPDQFMLDLAPEERRQRERDRNHWRTRADQVADEIVREPARVRDQYTVKATRLEPIGVVYLWPKAG